jgi:hypothetical protein
MDTNIIEALGWEMASHLFQAYNIELRTCWSLWIKGVQWYEQKKLEHKNIRNKLFH